MEININEVASGVADMTIEILNDSIDWQISGIEQIGDDYRAIHTQVLRRTIEIMYDNLSE